MTKKRGNDRMISKDFMMLWRVLKNKNGYTLVELLVVMGIIGLLTAITFGGYYSIRKEKYVQHVANLAQTSIRDTFIDILSTKVEKVSDTDCDNRAPKIKVVMIRSVRSNYNIGKSPIVKFAMCEGSTGTLSTPIKIEEVDTSSGLNYKEDLEVSSSYGNSGYTFFIFTSPYGKYYLYHSGYDDENIAINKLYTLGGSGVGWEKDNNQIYVPKLDGRANVTPFDNMMIKFDSDPNYDYFTNVIMHKITISKAGNVKLD